MVAMWGGNLTVVGVLDGGGDSFRVRMGLCPASDGRCWVHCSL